MREGKKPMAVSEKYMLTIKEAAEYFNIGIKKMRRLAEDNKGEFAIYMGNRYLVIRERFEQYIVNLSRGGEDEEEWKIQVQEWKYSYTDGGNWLFCA